MKVNIERAALIACKALAVLVMMVTTWVAIPQPAAATQQFATQTGLACGACHQNPKGAGALTPTGEKFKANGNKMPPKSDTSTTPK